MEWLDGGSFWDNKTKLTPAERQELVELAASINSSNYEPPFSYDNWAITSFEKEYNEYHSVLTDKDTSRVNGVLEEFLQLDLNLLPKTFVHGDLIATNVITTQTGLYAVDFSVANYYPRIQELTILLVNLPFDENSAESSKKMYYEAITNYSSKLELTDAEHEALPTFIQAGHAMHILGASKAIARGEDDAENQYWLNLGRAGLSHPKH